METVALQDMNTENTKLIYMDELMQSTPELVAHLFANMDSEQQAAFFNHVGRIATDWHWPMQLQYITEDEGLTLRGRQVMQSIGEYSHWGLSCRLTEEIVGK